jgi:hypothetical protein
MDNVFAAFVMQLVVRSPTLLTYVIGLIVAVTYWKRYPRPSFLVFTGMGMALITWVSSAFIYTYLPRAMIDFGWDHRNFTWITSAIGFVTNLINAGALTMLLTAVFIGRRHFFPQWPADEDQPVAPGIGPDTRIQD